MLTDADGRFVFASLPDGLVTVTATKAGYVTTNLRPSPIRVAAASPTTVAVHLTPGAVLAGTIHTVSGRPADGVTVIARPWRSVGGRTTLEPESPNLMAHTDDQGRYRIWGIAAASYVLECVPSMTDSFRVAHANLADDSSVMKYVNAYYPGVADVHEASTITLASGDVLENLDFSIRYVRTAAIDGVVIGLSGHSDDRFDVNLSDLSGGDSVRTDEHGRFRFDSAQPGPVMISVGDFRSGTTGGAGQLELNLGASDIHDVVLVLQPAAEVFGEVTFEGISRHDNAYPSIVLRRVEPSFDAHDPIVERAGLSGSRYALSGLSPGLYVVQVDIPQLPAWRLKTLVLDGHDLGTTTLELKAGQSLRNLTIVLTDRAPE